MVGRAMEQMRQGIYVYVMYEKIQTLVSFNFFKRVKKRGGVTFKVCASLAFEGLYAKSYEKLSRAF